MSISENIDRIKQAKTAIINSIKGKGVTVPIGTKIDAISGYIDSIQQGGGGSLPSGITAIDYGTITVSSDFTTTRQTYNHNLGVTPDLVMVYATANVATNYSMLMAIRGTMLGWRSSTYNSHMLVHGNTTTTVTYSAGSNTTTGVCTFTATTFQLASASTSYYWRAGSYKYLAIKFA